jgi:hypothetical protein
MQKYKRPPERPISERALNSKAVERFDFSNSDLHRQRLDQFLENWTAEIRVDWPRCSPIWRPEVRQ